MYRDSRDLVAVPAGPPPGQLKRSALCTYEPEGHNLSFFVRSLTRFCYLRTFRCAELFYSREPNSEGAGACGGGPALWSGSWAVMAIFYIRRRVRERSKQNQTSSHGLRSEE